MITKIRGTLEHISESSVEIDTGSFSVEVFVPSSVMGRMPAPGGDTELYTYLNVREDEMSLYGFLTRDELAMFRRMINVSGIGPKGALGILSAMTPDEVAFAVLSGDVKALSKAPGIGRKTAERLIIELKDRVSADHPDFAADSGYGAQGADAEPSARSEAVMALTVLGYSNSDALRAVRGLDTNHMTTEEILKEALRRLSR
ncbi:MAG: Holliday junction branch migration protein RuvA [Lachnospiraceae bacterium]|nr:Holliday junction branch migration protein RuvA [Lachnospiraceae bacterium]MBP5254220.1 Holliday junction branch migration protein RuvA [Lachnospiraceae bacterium]